MSTDEGKIYQRAGSSKWQADFCVGGQRFRESCKTSDEQSAQQYLQRRIAEETKKYEEARGDYLSFQEAVVRFFQLYAVDNELKPKTLQGYTTSLKTYMRYFEETQDGNALMPLGDMDDKWLARFIRWRRDTPTRNNKTVSKSTLQRDVNFFSTVWNRCREDAEVRDFLPSVCPANELPRGFFKVVERTRFLSEDELSALIEALNPGMHRWIVLALTFTGMRHRAEATELKWEHVDLEKGTIKIVEGKGGKDRIIALDENAKALFQELKSHSLSHSKKGFEVPYVFWHTHKPLKGEPREKPQKFTTFQKFWDRARKQAGIPDVRIHDLRHTYATMYVQHGGADNALQHNMGHSSIKQTEKYRHWIAEKQLEDVSRVKMPKTVMTKAFNDLVSGNQNNQ